MYHYLHDRRTPACQGGKSWYQVYPHLLMQEMFEQQNIAFGYFLRPEAAPEERVYQELPASAAQLAPLLENYLETYNTRFNTNLNLGT